MHTFLHANPDRDFIKQAFSLDVRRLESVPSADLSKYIIGLSQYLIYFRSQYNKVLVQIKQKQRFIEATVYQMLTKELLNEHKTKKDATEFIISSSPTLAQIREDLDILKDEELLMNGIDKTITELIVSLKREMTRREHEMDETRTSRRF